MKSTILLTTVALVAAAPQFPPPSAWPKMPLNLPNCKKTTDIKPLANLLEQYKPGDAQFPCDMGAPIPFGPAPKGCSKYEVLVARGTSEPGAFGSMVGDPLIARLTLLLPGVRGYAVQYPADAPNRNAAPAELAAHMEIGPNDILHRLRSQAKECPDQKFALVGYSQGGGVLYRAATEIAKDKELSEKVKAVVLYGARDGSAIALPHGKVLANCARGDMACPEDGKNVATPLGHVSYNDVGSKWHDRSAEFIASAFQGKELGPKVMKEATGGW